MATEATGELKLDISQLKKALTDANEDIKTANRLFKKETDGLDNWAKDSEGLAAKLKQLTRTLEDQKSILNSRKGLLSEQQKESQKNRDEVDKLKKALADLAEKGVSKESAEYKKLEAQLASANKSLADSESKERKFQDAVDDATASIGKTEREIKKWEQAQENLNKENESASKKVKDQEKQLKELKKEYADIAVSQGKDSEAAKKLASQISNLSADLKTNKKALDDAQKEADQLDHSFDETGKSAKEAGNDIEKAGEQAGGFKDNFLAGIGVQAVTKLWDGLKNAIKGVTNALKDAVKESAAYGDEVLTMSKTTGLATDTIQEFKYAEDLLDVSTGTMAASLKKLKAQISSANKGGAAATTAFENLGISIYNSNGQLRDSEDIYFDAIEALGNISNETERDAAAMDLFGKSATDLNPLIQAGSKELAKLRQEAHDMGAVLSDESLEALSATQDAMDRLSKKAQTLKTSLAAKLAPSVEKVMDGLVKAFDSPLVQKGIDELASGIGQIIDKGGKLAKKVIPPIINYAKKLLPLYKDIGKSLLNVAKSILPAIKEAMPIVLKLIQKLVPLIKDTVTLIGKIIKTVQPLVKSILGLLSDVLGDLIDDISGLVKSWGPALNVFFKGVSVWLQVIVEALHGLYKAANAVISPVKKLVNWIGEKIGGSTKEASTETEKLGATMKRTVTPIEHVTKSWDVLNQEYRDNIDAAKDAIKSHQELYKEYGESYLDTKKETDEIADLYAELETLVDAKGRVKKEDEERAKFITQRLEELTGLEIEWNGLVIKSYNDIATAIQDVIDKKLASKLLELAESRAEAAKEEAERASAAIYDSQAAIEGYDQALLDLGKDAEDANAKIADYWTNYNKLTDAYNAASKMYKDGIVDTDGILKVLDTAQGALDYYKTVFEELGIDTSILGEYFDEVSRLQQAVIDANGQEYDSAEEYQSVLHEIIGDAGSLIDYLDELDSDTGILDEFNNKSADIAKTIGDITDQREAEVESMKTLREAEAEYLREVSAYEEAYVEYAKGNYAAVQELLEDDIANKYKYIVESRKATAEEISEMDRETKIRTAAYERYREGLLSGDKRYNLKGLEAAKKYADDMVDVYEKAVTGGNQTLIDEAHSLGVSFVNGFTAGIKEMAKKAAEQARQVAQDAKRALKNELQIASPSKVTMRFGKFFDLGFAKGIRDNVSSVNSAVAALTDQSVSGLSGGSGRSTTQNFTQNIYAPKTPSRIELYRDAKNLLAMGGLA